MVVGPKYISANVKLALQEDIGSGDVTADLVPDNKTASARLISRESAILCGKDWFNEVFNQLNKDINIDWHASDGDRIKPDQLICEIKGNARSLLSGERSAINFLQTLSGTATKVSEMVERIKDTKTKILDTRKTIPGLRLAQKYAVSCGGGKNHRIGLYDAILIKENHIFVAGSISAAVSMAKRKGVSVEVEVENLDELNQAISAGADQVLLDNFSIEQLKKAVEITQGRTKLEASGNIDESNIREVAETGVDYISIGALTKHVRAIDFSMRISLN